MRVDFYQLSRDPPEAVVARLAENTLDAGERLVVVCADRARREAISRGLWCHSPESFLAHGEAGGAHDLRQPILLSASVQAPNGARFIVLADGVWRPEAEGFTRVFLLFGGPELEAARATWRLLGQRDEVERHFWKQDGGKWRQGP
jgi:DNA polymerase-3 subunit chi